MLQVDLRNRGYLVLYHEGEKTYCPGCGHSHWDIGRTMAECAFCTTALPIAQAGVTEALPTFVQSRDTGLQENSRQAPLLLQSVLTAMITGGFIFSVAM